MLKRNLFFIDTESSGLHHEDGCEITEVYATAFNYWDLSPHHAGPFHAFIKPQRPEKAQAGALKVIGEGWTIAQTKGLDPKIVWSNFVEWIESINSEGNVLGKPIGYAYNQDHDRRFLVGTLKEYKVITKDEKWGWDYPWGFMFDGMQSIYELFHMSPNLVNLKLDTAFELLNMKRDTNHHTAKEDVEKFAEMMIRLLKFQRESYKRLRVAK